MARASKSEQTGSIGVSEVTGKFGRIGFGFAEITRHDNGTDVFLMARDVRRFDLGLTLAAQIKGGDSYFGRPEKDSDGHIKGWWFADPDGAHIDDWLRHGLPYVLVMHDLNADISYWVHITEDAIVSTGKGKKILVPAHQRVDEDSREALITIAATTRPAPAWEGTAWRGAASILDRDLVRFALVVPRLVAPHPSAQIEAPLSASQGIAMVMQARIYDIERLRDRGLVPLDDREGGGADDWYWRLYAALYRRVTIGEVDHLAEMQQGAPNSAAAVAAAVAAAACLMEEDRADEAVKLLEKALEADKEEPVDHAWMSVQLARGYAETGRLDEARALAASVQGLAATHSTDATATAIAGAGAQLLFSLLGWGEGDVGKTIEAADTSASWWRQQTRGRALADALDRTYREWTYDESIRWSASDTSNDQLHAASLNASLVGAQGDWRQLAGELGKDMLVRLNRYSAAAEAQSGVSQLRYAGSARALKDAVGRLVSDGPAISITDATRGIDLDRLTHTSAKATLELLRHGGAVLAEDVADGVVSWLVRTVSEPDEFIRRVRPAFDVETALADTLAGVLRSANLQSHKTVIDYLAAKAPVEDELVARSWARVVRRLPQACDAEAVSHALENAEDGHRLLRDALRGVAANHIESVRDVLLADILESGSPDALSAWGEVRTLPAEAMERAIDHIVSQLAERRASASSGVIRGWDIDQPRNLVVINKFHGARAQWTPLVEYIEDRNVYSGEKAGALEALAWAVQDIPAGLRPESASSGATRLVKWGWVPC